MEWKGVYMPTILVLLALILGLFLVCTLIFLIVCAVVFISLSASVKAVSVSKKPRKLILNIICSIVGLFLGLGIGFILVLLRFDDSVNSNNLLVFSIIGSFTGVVFGLINAKLLDSAIGSIILRVNKKKLQ